jgi:CheY-specific phosphatase CheX
MQLTEYQPTLEAAAMDVLETMFFASFEEEPPEGEYATTCASLRFRGSLSGYFAMKITTAVAEELSANFLGDDSESSAETTETGSAVNEIANMICGSFLSAFDENGRFDLEQPAEISPNEFEAIPASISQTLYVSEGMLEIKVNVEDLPA